MQAKKFIEQTRNKVYYAKLSRDKLIYDVEHNKKVALILKKKKTQLGIDINNIGCES
jgi:hypothetical protein